MHRRLIWTGSYATNRAQWKSSRNILQNKRSDKTPPIGQEPEKNPVIFSPPGYFY